MPTIRQIREDINDTLTFLDVAEVLSAISSLAYVNISKIYESCFIGLFQSLEQINKFLIESLNYFDEDKKTVLFDKPVKKAAILIGSNIGFCGKFNNEIKTKSNYEKLIGPLGNYDYIVLIGNQIFGVDKDAENKYPFPVSKKIFLDELINKKSETIEEIIKTFEGTGSNLEISILSNAYDHKLKKGKTVANKFLFPDSINVNSSELIKNSGYYQTLNNVILEPDSTTFIKNLLQYYFKLSFLSLLVQSEIVENYNRMNAMNQAKDEIDIILKKLKRKLQKMRQTKITNELLEVIQSH